MKYIELTKGYMAMVDDEDYEELSKYKWHYNSGYAERKERRDGKQIHISMHRFLMNFPSNLVDHWDTNKLNNQKSNLRVSTRSQNAMNMKKRAGKKYKGVCRDGDSFRSQIWKDNKRVFSAVVKKEIWAAMIYDLNAAALFGEFANLNFPNALGSTARIADGILE